MLLFCLQHLRNVLGLVRRGESLRVEVGTLLVLYHGQLMAKLHDCIEIQAVV